MDFERAREIINSESEITVLHRNQPVWIEDLNPGSMTASVTAGQTTYTVPLQELLEG